MRLSEAFNDKVRFSNVADPDSMYDEHEPISQYEYLLDEDPWFTVCTVSPQMARYIKTIQEDMTVIEAYEAFADRDQKRIVQYKMKHWDTTRIVIMRGDSCIDGHHHLVAGILGNKPVSYINLDEVIDETD